MVSTEILTQLGFNEKQAQLYISCLELGAPTVVQLGRHTGISRGSIYDLLDEMLEKGYVSKVHKDKHMVFSATDPEILRKKYQSNLRDFEFIMPQLKGLFSKQSKPMVRYYEGLEGVWQVYQDTLTSTTEILNYANSKEVRKYFPNYDEEYVKIRAKKRIFLKGISPDDDFGRRVKNEDKDYYREIRLLSSEEFSFTNEINIYDNKLAIISFQSKPMGVIIESQEVANTQRDIFKMAWQFACLSDEINRQKGRLF